LQKKIAHLKKSEAVAHQNIKAISKTAETYKLLVESSSDMIFIVDLGGNFLFANKAFKKCLGFSAAEIKKINGFSLVHPKDLARVRKQFALLIEGKHIENMEYRYKKKNGSYLYLSNNATPIFDAHGNVIAAIGATRDVHQKKRFERDLQKLNEELESKIEQRTKELLMLNDQLTREIIRHKQAQLSLQKSEEKYRTLVENAMDGIYILSPEGFEYVNPAFEKTFGFKAEEVCDKKFNFHDFIHPEDKGMMLGREEARKKGKKNPATYTFRVITKTQELKYVEVDTIPLPGEKLRILGILRDITVGKETEHALRESEEKFKNLAEQSPNMIFINQDGRLVYVNMICEEIMGYKRKDFYASDFEFLNLIAPESREKAKKSFLKNMSGKDIGPLEYTIITKKGKRIEALTSTKIILYKGKSAILGIVTDISKRKRTEEQLKKALHDNNILLREIHHRVKNNMQIISSLLRLQARNIKDKKLHEAFKSCQNRIRSMALIHEKFYQSEDLARIELDRYIHDVAIHLLQTYGIDQDAISLNMEMEVVHLDINKAVSLGLIINELLSNSLRHAFPDKTKGEIQIRLRKIFGTKTELIISDNGVGIPEDIDFSNTPSLGMLLVNDLVKQIDGQIDLKREGGTSFRITF